MSVDRSFVEENRADLARLQALVARLSDSDLTRPLGEGWTVSSALAHVAFWDQRIIAVLDFWETEGIEPEAISVADWVNAAALPGWLAIAPREAAKLLLATAEAVNRRVEALRDEQVEAIRANKLEINLSRRQHRTEHIEHIERELKGRAIGQT